MKCSNLTSAAVLVISSTHLMGSVSSFQTPCKKKNNRTPCNAETKKTKNIDVDYFNPVRIIDLDHAHECVGNFGQCSIDELEDMRRALHTERIQHQSSGYQHDFAEELDHRLLEEDLNFQLALLKNEMHTLPQWSSPHFMTNGKASFSPPPSMISPQSKQQEQREKEESLQTSQNESLTSASVSSSVTATKNPPPAVKSFFHRSGDMFLIPNGVGDAAAIVGVLLLVSLAQL